MNVSIVIPTFNRGPLVVRAVESALAQTHPQREIIVIDDGSTDDTEARLKKYRHQIRYLYQENQGAGAAQNRGIEVAHGEWVAILASDDNWLPNKLETQLRVLTTLGTEFGACFTDCHYLGNPALPKTAFQGAGLFTRGQFGPLDNPIEQVLAKHPALYVQSMLARRTLLEKVNRFKEDLVVGEDTDLLFRLSFQTRFCIVDEPLVQIDRTPFRSRLSDLFGTGDLAYPYIERRLKQWLQMPEVVDGKVRRRIQSSLHSIYYSWAIAKLYRCEFSGAFEKLQLIRADGPSYGRIWGHLFYRAVRKSISTLGPSKEMQLGK